MKKRIVGLIVALAMITPLLSVSAESDVTSVFFASDYQFTKERTPELFGDDSIESCQPVLDELMKQVKEDEKKVETAVFGGDYTQNDGHRSASSEIDTRIFGSTLQYHYGNTPVYSIDEMDQVINKHYEGIDSLYVQGNHDPDTNAIEGKLLSETGPYEYGEYTVYVLNDQDFVGARPRINIDNYNSIVPGTIATIDDPEGKVKETADALRSYLEKRVADNDFRPVFICSHQPLHDNTDNRNEYAYLIYEAINPMAARLDIVYFFAHTHRGSDEIGGGLSYVAKETKMKVPFGDENREVSLNFTYTNYGFLGNYQGANEVLSSTCVDLEAKELVITKYIVNQPKVEYRVRRINPAEYKRKIVLTIGSDIMKNNQEEVILDVPAQIINERTMVPLRAIFEALGADVMWDGDTKTITAVRDNDVVVMQVGNELVFRNDEKITIDTPPQIVGERTLVPARAVAESFLANVDWNGDTKTVTITE